MFRVLEFFKSFNLSFLFGTPSKRLPGDGSAYLAAVGRDDSQIGGNPVAALHLHQVTDHHLLGVDAHLLSVTDDQGLLRGRDATDAYVRQKERASDVFHMMHTKLVSLSCQEHFLHNREGKTLN